MTTRQKLVRLLLSAGCACLIVMALTHVAERLHILPGMGWGLPDSPGHYLDLFSVISGVALLLVGCVMAASNFKLSHYPREDAHNEWRGLNDSNEGC
jgi:hypothetical protein